MFSHLVFAAGLTSFITPISSLVIRAPTPADFATLNTTVSGRLFAAYPWSRPCYSSYNGQSQQPNQAQCQDVQSKYFNNSIARSDAFGAWGATQWEECMSADQKCDLNWMNPTDSSFYTPPKDCKQGSVPSYYIDVKQKEDVIAALAFVKKTGIKLSIKNTGHDFTGRSTAPGSLSLWMHHIKYISDSSSFVPDGCPTTQKYTAVTFGAGQQFGEIVSYADSKGLMVISGTDEGVGAAGGWGQGGGHSSMSHALGMGADRTLQYRIVTPDGVYRTANACQNTDLFWALRGGGGGTFGIVMEATHLANPRVPLRVASINWTPTNDNYKKVLKVFIDNATTFANQGWGGYVTANIGNIVLATPKLTLAEAQASMKALIDVTSTMGGYPAKVTETSSYASWFNDYMTPNSGSQDAVGLPIVFSSRLIPKANHDTDAGRAQLLDAIYTAQTSVFWTQIMFTTPYGSGYNGSDTSVNPAWRNSLYHVMLINTWSENASKADKQAAFKLGTTSADYMRAVTPGSGAYHNEADTYEPDWQNSFWGSNYARLLTIKNQYDPTGVLDCWHCVGWKGVSDPRYSCYL